MHARDKDSRKGLNRFPDQEGIKTVVDLGVLSPGEPE